MKSFKFPAFNVSSHSALERGQAVFQAVHKSQPTRELSRASVSLLALLAHQSRYSGTGFYRHLRDLRHSPGLKARIKQEGLFDSHYFSEQLNDPEASEHALSHYLGTAYIDGANPHPAFDTHYYLENNPDVLVSGENPLRHYVHVGGRERRNPVFLFDTDWYLSQVQDFPAEGLTPLGHYLTVGATQGLDPHPLFCTLWYLQNNPDVAAGQANPLVHYLNHGWRENRAPHPVFNPLWYSERYPEAAESDYGPLAYYLETGWKLGHNPCFLFDTQTYLTTYPDVAALGIEPLSHYLKAGWKEDRNPHTLFDTAWYLKHYPDVAAAGLNPLFHFLSSGWQEGRGPHPLFDVSWYRENNADVAQSGVNPIEHFLVHGWREARDPHPLFDMAAYLAANPDVADQGINPLIHYVEKGAREFRRAHWLFDAEWYLSEYPDVALTGVNPLVHYLSAGWKEGRFPHPLMDGDWYLDQLRAVGQRPEPLTHFVTSGWKSGLSPHPVFDTQWYLIHNPDVAAKGVNPLQHYLSSGWAEGRAPHPLFDPVHYHHQAPEVADAEIEPLTHFLRYGWKNGVNPNALFDVRYYLDNYADQITEGMSPLVHYIRLGWRMEFAPHPLFDGGWYYEHNPDVANAGLNPLGHFLSSGWTENRNPSAFFSVNWYKATYDEVGDRNPVAHYAELPKGDMRAPHPLFDPKPYAAAAGLALSRSEDVYRHFIEAGIAAKRSPGDLFNRFVETNGFDTMELDFPDLVKLSFEAAIESAGTSQTIRSLTRTAVADQHFEILKAGGSLAKTRVCLFASYLPDGVVPTSTAYYLKALKSAGMTLVFVAATERSTGLIGLPDDVCHTVLVKDNHGYDFASWALALNALPSLWAADSILFTNDSVLGPVSAESLSSACKAMQRMNADYVGLTDSFQVQHHVQSYFFMLKAQALTSPDVRKYWNGVLSYSDKDKVIGEYELGSLGAYEAAGLKTAVVFPTDESLREADVNPTLHLWRDLLEAGYPFIKMQLLRDDIEGIETEDWEQYVSKGSELHQVINARLGSKNEIQRKMKFVKSREV